MLLFKILGWLAFVGAAACAFRANAADADLQALRAPGAPRAAFWFVPARWRRRLYAPEAAPLVARAWRMLLAVCALGLLAMLLLAVGYGGE